jgi:multiple sugar transport system permease protein
MAVQELEYSAHRVRTPRRVIAVNVVYYVLLSIAAVMFFFPFFWTVMTSLKRPSEILLFPPTVFPEIPQWHNYARVFEKVPFIHWTGSTLFIVFASTTGMLLSASLAGYGFARFDFKIKEPLFIITLGTMMLPAQVTLIPQFVLFHKLDWIDSFKPLWVPSWFGGGAFAIFLLRQFMMTLPRDLDEAAIIDGASFVRIFWNILIPLCKPVLATLAVISIIGRWNDFLGPLIYIRTMEKFTIAVGLNYFRFNSESGGQPLQHLLMAASVMSTLPLIILFFSAQQYFVQGIALTGIKG